MSIAFQNLTPSVVNSYHPESTVQGIQRKQVQEYYPDSQSSFSWASNNEATSFLIDLRAWAPIFWDGLKKLVRAFFTCLYKLIKFIFYGHEHQWFLCERNVVSEKLKSSKRDTKNRCNAIVDSSTVNSSMNSKMIESSWFFNHSLTPQRPLEKVPEAARGDLLASSSLSDMGHSQPHAKDKCKKKNPANP
jgi:hypothetical protein